MIAPVVDWNKVRKTMPAQILRRTWFANQAGVEHRSEAHDFYVPDYSPFVDLLYQLDPRQARDLRAQNARPRVFAKAVIEHCKDLFPLNEVYCEEMFEEDTIIDVVPVATMGFDPFDDYISSPAIAACMVVSNVYTESETGETLEPEHFECLKKYRLCFDTWQDYRVAKAPKHAPRGRRFIEPWNALGELFLWATGQTGYNFLDISEASLGEGYGYPEWNVGEIRDLAQSWKGANPIFERANELREYIDQDPTHLLPLLIRAVLGDRDALYQITVPTGKQTTLAEVLK